MYDINSCYIAKDVSDAIRALEENPKAVLICGGSDVLIKIREGRLAGCDLVSIHDITSLKGIHIEEDGTIVIGSGTVFSHITNDPMIQKYLPMLGYAVDQVGGPQIRNVGTIGGNVCNGVTSADSASSLCAMNAVMELQGSDGMRRVPIGEWYAGPGKTVRNHDEILTSIRVARQDYEGFCGQYIKYGKRNAMEIATLGCALWVKLSADRKQIQDLRLAYGVAGPNPMRCPKTEELLRGMEINDYIYELIGKSALEEVNPRSSWRASKEFRLQLVRELAGRALRQAVSSRGGEADA